jgi:hypothetical protein
MGDLAFHLHHPDSRAEAVLAFVFESLGIRAERLQPPELWDRPHLVHGGQGEPLANGITIEENPRDILWPELLAGTVDPAGLRGRVPFDLVAAIGSFLRDDVHRDAEPEGFDGHGRLQYQASLPARTGFGDRPIVNVYVSFLGRLLRDRLGVTGTARWPGGRVAAIGLSHDVDHPDRYALLGSAVRPWRLRRHPRTYLRAILELASARLPDPTPRDFWLFDEVAASESALGFRSTFFFATVPFHARRGAPPDVAYDIGQSRFRDVLRSLQRAGFEIGLHASYRAHEDRSRLTAERNRLKILAGAEISGVRHHYWNLGRDVPATLRAHEEAGFTYDSSLAFNDHIGFRRSVALPFHSFDPVFQRPLRTVELPTFCMDGNLLYASSEVDAAVEAVGRAVDQIVETGGMGAIDWHIQTSYPANREFRAWGVAYQEILGLLASRADLWVTNLGAVSAWESERARRLSGGDSGSPSEPPRELAQP